jgi:tetratricopeptide (TPR) repeat protein
MADATLTQLLMFGWLFSLGGDDPFDKDNTIGALEDQEVIIPAASASQASPEQALEHYRQYLDSADGDPTSRLAAMQRMSDLSLQVNDASNLDSPDYAAELAVQSDAILFYEQLLEQESEFEKADLVLYQLSRTYESAGAFNKSLETLDRLVAQFPASQYIGEAQFRRGEILFALQDYHAASQAYRQVVALGSTTTFYQQSMYKFGWSQFKEAEYDGSINVFLDLLNLRLAAAAAKTSLQLNLPENPQRDFGMQQLAQRLTTEAIALQTSFASMTRAEREFVDDGLRALSLMFSYMDGAETIGLYVDRRGNIDPTYLLYTSLGDLYLQQERYLDAANTFDAFVAREPNHYNSPDLAMRTIAVYKAGRFPGKVLEAKRDFVDAYGLEQEYWNIHDPAQRGEVITTLKANLTDLAQHDHAEAQRTGDMALYALAAGWYRRYLEYFPSDPDSAERRFLLGEILVETKDYPAARDSFLLAAYDYPGYERAAEAGYAALLASRSQHATLADEAADVWLDQQLKQAVKFAQSFPEHEQTPAVLSNTAEAYFAKQKMIAAIIVAGQLIKTEPQADPGLLRITWTVVGHGHFDLEHYARAERSYLQLRAMGPAGLGGSASTGGLTAVELDERIAASIYRQGEQAQVAGEVAVAVGHYMRVRDAVPASSIASQGVYDASVLLFNAERWLGSIEIMVDFRTTYPAHEYVNSVTQNLAVAYQRSGQPLLAAVEYEAVAGFSLNAPEVRREALWNSGELYEEGADIESARRVWRIFVRDFPQPVAESIEVRQRLADLALEADDARDRRDWLAQIIKVDGSAGEQRSGRTKTLAANAQLELADPKRLAFNAVRLDIPLQKSLKSKKALMEDALTAYGKASAYGIAAVTTVATYRIAELYQQLSVDLMESERPAGLSVEELDLYEILLEEQAFPFEEQAIEIYEVNAGRAANGYYDEWVARSYAQLAILMPGRYAKYEQAESQIEELY